MHKELTQEEAVEFAGAWWLLGLLGLASVVAGGILVAKPSHSLATLAVVLGIFILLDGIVELVASFRRDVENPALASIVGVLSIIVGIVLIRHPTHAASALGLLIGIWLVTAGVVRLVRAIRLGHRIVLRAAIALVEIAAGIAVVAEPHIGYATLAVLIGIWLIINGIGMAALALAIRAVEPRLGADVRRKSESVG